MRKSYNHDFLCKDWKSEKDIKSVSGLFQNSSGNYRNICKSNCTEVIRVINSNVNNNDEKNSGVESSSASNIQFYVRRSNSANYNYSSLNDDNDSQHIDDRPLSATPVIGGGSNANYVKNDFQTTIPINNTPYYCYDLNSPNENSESSELASYTDLKLMKLRSRLRAETDVIRKWKEEAIVKSTVYSDCQHACCKLSSESTKEEMNKNYQQNYCSRDCDELCSNSATSVYDKQLTIQYSEQLKNMNNKNEEENSVRIRDLEAEVHNLMEQLDTCCRNLQVYEEELKLVQEEHVKLRESYQSQLRYCRQLEDQKNGTRSDNDAIRRDTVDSIWSQQNDFTNQIARLESSIQQRDNIIAELKRGITKELSEKDKMIKENVRLKEEQSQLKNEMTHLRNIVSKSRQNNDGKLKRTFDFCEEQKKLTDINNNLKTIVSENKSIFQSISGDLCERNERLSDAQYLVKFLEDKLAEKESENQNLRKQLDYVTHQLQQNKEKNRIITTESTEKNKILIQEKNQLAEEWQKIKFENTNLYKTIEALNAEVSVSYKTQAEFKNRAEQLTTKAEELKQKHNATIQQCSVHTVKLEELTCDLNERQSVVKRLLSELNTLQAERKRLDKENYRLREQATETQHTWIAERSKLEQDHNKEISTLKKRIETLLVDSRKATRYSEKVMNEQSKEMLKLESQINELKQQKSEMVEYLYKLPTSSIKWSNFFQ